MYWQVIYPLDSLNSWGLDYTLHVYSCFKKGCQKKVDVTILKGIVGGFVCPVLQRNLKEWHEWPWTYAYEC